MKNGRDSTASHVRMRLVEVGGRTSQDFGFGRILGQILVYLYLFDGECSLDRIEQELGLSKAAVSIAARQLESLGLLRRVRKKGDRKNYYRTADNIGIALQQGILALVRRKMQNVAVELEAAFGDIRKTGDAKRRDADLAFLLGRMRRAKELSDKASSLLDSRIFKMLVG